MRLEWHGHSCFRLCTDAGTVVFDPYADGSVPGLAPLSLTADAVLCSHGHADHSAAGAVTLTGSTPSFTVEKIPCWHDEVHGLKRGPNTIHVVTAEGMRTAHLGDLGHRLKADRLRRLGRVDVLLIPVGGHYTIDGDTAAEVAEAVGARIVVPMHYRKGPVGYAVLSEADEFLKHRHDVAVYDTDTLDITPETPAQTAVLRCAHA